MLLKQESDAAPLALRGLAGTEGAGGAAGWEGDEAGAGGGRAADGSRSRGTPDRWAEGRPRRMGRWAAGGAAGEGEGWRRRSCLRDAEMWLKGAVDEAAWWMAEAGAQEADEWPAGAAREAARGAREARAPERWPFGGAREADGWEGAGGGRLDRWRDTSFALQESNLWGVMTAPTLAPRRPHALKRKLGGPRALRNPGHALRRRLGCVLLPPLATQSWLPAGALEDLLDHG